MILVACIQAVRHECVDIFFHTVDMQPSLCPFGICNDLLAWKRCGTVITFLSMLSFGLRVYSLSLIPTEILKVHLSGLCLNVHEMEGVKTNYSGCGEAIPRMSTGRPANTSPEQLGSCARIIGLKFQPRTLGLRTTSTLYPPHTAADTRHPSTPPRSSRTRITFPSPSQGNRRM